jgi:hypothetical protein
MGKVFGVYSMEGESDSWMKIGMAYRHRDRQGFALTLYAVPILGSQQIVLRTKDPNDSNRHKHSAKKIGS